MKGFDGRSAVEEYMSTHPLSFSTPDLILKEFVVSRGIDSLGSGSKSEKDQAQNILFKSTGTTMETSTNKPASTFCIECGSKLNSNSKFCTKCGTKQETI